MMRRLALFILLIASTGAMATQLTFRDVRSDDIDRLRQRLPALFGGAATLALMDEAIRLLVAQGAYDNVFLERGRAGQFVLIGKPLRLVDDIVLNGVSGVDRADIREVIEIKKGDRFDRKRAVSAAERVKRFYGESGFFNASVELNFDKADDGHIRLRFEIQENTACRIQGLVFDTKNADLRARLERRFRRLAGRDLTTERVQRLLKDLNEFLITNRYLNAEVSGPEPRYNDPKTEAVLEFTISEPFRWEFYFAGHNRLSRADIYRALDLNNVERKNVDPATEGAERLRRHYLDKGYPNIQLETSVSSPGAEFLKRVNYEIEENPRVRIKRVDVQGRISRPSRYYQGIILKNSSALVTEGFYNRTDLENGFKNLVTDLRNQGFLRAKVLSSRIEYNNKRDEVIVFVILEEGPQTQIRSVDFEGNRFISNFELSEITGLHTNTPLRLNAFEAGIEKLKSFYRNQGFLEMKLLNEGEGLIEYNERGTQARIKFHIFEGPRIRVHNIAVEGNTFTKSRVVLKEADFQKGEVLTPAKLEEATTRLNKTGLFSRVDIRTLEEGTNVAERTLVISITERDPGLFRFGAGVNNERNLTVRGFTGLGYANLWGTGRGISSRLEIKSNVAEINYPEHELTLGYLEPFVLNTLTRGRVNLTRSERVFDYQSTYDVVSITTSNKVDFLLERELTAKTKLTWKTWSLESRSEFERQGRCLPTKQGEKFDPDGGKCRPNVRQIGTVGPTLDIDYRDNPFLPTRGSFTRFVVDYSHGSLGSTPGIEFFRGEANYTYYKRVGSPRTVWANSVRGGYVANLSDDEVSGVPTSYSFLLGGIYTVRGFDLASDTERIPRQGSGKGDGPLGFEVLPGNQLLIRTDSHYYLLKSELRFTVYGEHGGVLFYDGGMVKVSGFDFGRPYRDAAGFGYRYNTPVGPLALDFAFKISPEPDERVFRFHFSIGTF